MAYEHGSVNSFREGLVEVRLSTGDSIQCVVDTGFDGGLMIPAEFAEEMQLATFGRLAFETVGGARMYARVGLVDVDWLNEVRRIEVIVSEGNDALIGTELLAETILTINYVARTLTISTAS